MNHAYSRSVGLCLSLALSTRGVLAGDAATDQLAFLAKTLGGSPK